MVEGQQVGWEKTCLGHKHPGSAKPCGQNLALRGPASSPPPPCRHATAAWANALSRSHVVQACQGLFPVSPPREGIQGWSAEWGASEHVFGSSWRSPEGHIASASILTFGHCWGSGPRGAT